MTDLFWIKVYAVAGLTLLDMIYLGILFYIGTRWKKTNFYSESFLKVVIDIGRIILIISILFDILE